MAEIISHINRFIQPEIWSPEYRIHKYWGRKPANVVARYISTYSSENDVILDPFAGSCVTGIEAIKHERKIIMLDLNPISELIAKVSLSNIDINQFNDEYRKMTLEVKEHLQDLYKIKCLKCGNIAQVGAICSSYVINCPICKKKIVMAESSHKKGKKQNIYVCPHCKNDFSYGNQDLIDEKEIEYLIHCPFCKTYRTSSNIKLPDFSTDFPYPEFKLYFGDKPFLTKRRAEDLEDLIPIRNIYGLSILMDYIKKIHEPHLRDAFLLAFTGSIPQVSRLMITTADSGPSWKIPEYIVYPTHWTYDVWSRFENRVGSIKRALNELSKMKFKQGETAEEVISGDKNWIFLRKDVMKLSNSPNKIPDSSIDYIFTDPPYGGDIQYFELDAIRNIWIDYLYNKDIMNWWKDEITISSSQGKDFNDYQRFMIGAFGELYRVLKSGKYLTVTFHNRDVETYSSLIRAAVVAGFELEQSVFQTTSTKSVKQQAQPYGSAVGDYYLRFRKPESEKKRPKIVEDEKIYERLVVENAIRMIAERGEPTPLAYLLTMYSKLSEDGALLSGRKNIDEVLKKYENEIFVLDNKVVYTIH